jgi:hypothetical protein
LIWIARSAGGGRFFAGGGAFGHCLASPSSLAREQATQTSAARIAATVDDLRFIQKL